MGARGHRVRGRASRQPSARPCERLRTVELRSRRTFEPKPALRAAQSSPAPPSGLRGGSQPRSLRALLLAGGGSTLSLECPVPSAMVPRCLDLGLRSRAVWLRAPRRARDHPRCRLRGLRRVPCVQLLPGSTLARRSPRVLLGSERSATCEPSLRYPGALQGCSRVGLSTAEPTFLRTSMA